MLWPYLVVFVLLGGLLVVSVRNRKRAMTEQLERAGRIDVGAEVMTTSGLYGTVVAKHDDGTVLLSIAPGVEVKWAVAALRDAESLSTDYRRGLDKDTAGAAGAAADAAAEVEPAGDESTVHKTDDGA